MQIVIAGLGKVGSYLAGELSMEGHDLMVVDTKPEKVRNVTGQFDVMGLSGSIVDSQTLQETGMENADLFIAVTTNDEINLLSCLLAKKAGCSRTIARVRNPEYAESLDYFKEQLGLEMILNPEMLAAQEIERVLSLPGAIDVDVFSSDNGQIYKFRIQPGSVLDGMPVKNVPSRVHNDVLICVDERNGQAHIPDGEFELQGKDLLYIAGSRKGAEEFFRKAGIRNEPARQVMIVGAGKIAHYLVSLLEAQAVDVTVIERDLESCERFSVLHPNTVVIQADACEQRAMEEEGLLDMDALVSLTGFDEENVFLSLYASKKAGLKTVTKVNRIFFNEVIQEMDLDSLINSKKLTAEYIIRHVRAINNSFGSNVETIHKLANDQVEAVEFHICAGAPVIGIPLKDLPLKSGVLIALITRAGETILPRGSDVMQEGDSVVVITNRSGFMDISDVLSSKARGSRTGRSRS